MCQAEALELHVAAHKPVHSGQPLRAAGPACDWMVYGAGRPVDSLCVCQIFPILAYRLYYRLCCETQCSVLARLACVGFDIVDATVGFLAQAADAATSLLAE